MPAGLIQAVEGEIGGNVLVTNLNAFSGGMEIKTFAPSENDYANARQDLLEELTEKAYQEFVFDHPEGFLLPRKTLELIEIIQENHFPEIGIPGDRFKLELVAKFSVWEINRSDIQPVAEKAILTIIDNNFVPVDKSLIINVVEEPQIEENGSLFLKLEVVQEGEPILNKSQIFQLVSGYEVERANFLLNQKYHFSSDPVIDIHTGILESFTFFTFQTKSND